jgi:Transposase DDE domain
LARKTGFVKIDSPIDGVTFIRLLFKNSEQPKQLSLNQMSLEVLDSSGKPISKQAIDGRFSDKSILFVQSIFESYLQKIGLEMVSPNQLGWMDLFERVLIKDGTRFDLPPQLAAHFKGFGGKFNSDSSICIQFEYDFKSGKIVELKLTSAIISDSKDAQLTIDNIQKGDLILRDLGYFGLNIFEYIAAKQAYYLSKLNTQTAVFELKNNQYEPLDFHKLYLKMNQMEVKTIELEVYIGKTKKIPTRLIVEQVPQQVYQQRIRTKKKETQKNGFQMRDEYAQRQHFNIYITNIEKEKLPPQAIRNIYRLRWQIELVFKQWKSTYGLDQTHPMKYERWLTLFYARLLLMLIHWQLYHKVKTDKYKKENKLLSITKCLGSLQIASHKITTLIGKGIGKFKATVDELVALIASKHDLEIKKGRKNQQEIIEIIYCLSTD